MTEHPEAYFRRTGATTFAATEHTGGAWTTTEQHVSPLCGLLVHVLERDLPRPDLALARVSIDILGVVPVDEVEVTARVVRAGRTIELAEVEATYAGRAVLRARVWRLAPSDTADVAAHDATPMPSPTRSEPWEMGSLWPGGYIGSIEVRRAAGAAPGRGRAWVTSPVALVADEEVSGPAAWTRLLDTANGVAVRAAPGEWAYPNVDLTYHLHRTPQGPWVGLDTSVTWGAEGVGLTSTVLHDEHGPVGTAAQVLTLRRSARR